MFPSLLPDAPARFLTDKNSFAVPSDLARHSSRYHRSRIAQRIQPSLLRTLPTLLFSTAASTTHDPVARSEQPNSLQSFSCFTLLPSHNTNTVHTVPSSKNVGPESARKPQAEIQSISRTDHHHTHQLPSKRHSSRQSSPWAATLQTPPQGCLVMLVKRRFARQHSVRYRCS